MDQEKIRKQWKRYDFGGKIGKVFGKEIKLMDSEIVCLKNSREKTSIWRIMVTDGSEQIPIVLKIYKLPLKENHEVELNMYKKGQVALGAFMPKTYWIEENSEEVWLFMEFVQSLRGQIKLTPKHYDHIIPVLAKFHAATYGNRIKSHGDIFESWLPTYDSKKMAAERESHVNKTKKYLELAMNDDRLKKVIEANYETLNRILQRGPIFFPEIMENGQSLIHGDLHIHNISSHNATDDTNWEIRFVDWESAKFAPGWYDMVVLVEILLDFRRDWRKDAEQIRSSCVNLYAEEMKKHGIVFQTEPMRLFKMAYLQRTLEKRLLNHIRRVLRGEESVLLERYIEKTILWGKELGLL
ncbi:phosphotransferase [Sporosarcina highlanderae]|uniref:Phosphotransferase n=1 Tax=Sporosarcina highlanderae TaxID=3035916 RepID=A0ABT8JVQ4_9BACL|nr:phosphotransferase [Sporosarcina highlanderae]MDN4609012.1 phosphotransferase [Sporosarcina highlanderae]